MKEMTWEELNKYIKNARKNTEFMEELHEFIEENTGKARRHC